MKFHQIAAKLREGTLEESDLDGVTPEDAIKVRREAGGGLIRASIDALATPQPAGPETFTGGQEWPFTVTSGSTGTFGAGVISLDGTSVTLMGDDDAKKKRVPYVMVSDGLIPPFSDRVKASGWDLSEYRYRGSPLLYSHNIQTDAPPIGRMHNVKKNQEMKRGGREFRAMTGEAEFVEGEIYPFAGMVEKLVDMGVFRGGSVGFDILKSRGATREEQEQMGMKPYSNLIEKASLYEYSVTAIGRDPNAQRMSAELLDPIERTLADWLAQGVYEPELIRFARDHFHGEAGASTRTQVVVGASVDHEPEPEQKAEKPDRFARFAQMVDSRLTEIERSIAGMREEFSSPPAGDAGTKEPEQGFYDSVFDMPLEDFAKKLQS